MNQNHKLKVLLIAGGDSMERDVSLGSSREIDKAMRELGHEVLVVDPFKPHIKPTGDASVFFGDAAVDTRPPDIAKNTFTARHRFIEVLEHFDSLNCDVVFNGLHGGAGEDGTLQGVLDYLGIPYTGSGMAACAVAMDKALSKQLVAHHGVPVADEVYVDDPQRAPSADEIIDRLGLPVVVKPNHEGSSVGVTIVQERNALAEAIDAAKVYDGHYMIEKFIDGKEITVGMLDGADLPVLEIRPKDGFYDYANKYQTGACEYLVPAPLDDAVTDAVKKASNTAYNKMGCSGYARVDFRLSTDDQPYFLEVNTLPGMTSNSLVPKAARAVGIDFHELVDRILHLSLGR